MRDNCPLIANANQADRITPDNGIGDACDDPDNDSIADLNDNCPLIANANQADRITPANGIGDACDDPDNDGIADLNDNCPSIPNRNQRDSNGDGDVCDHDTDTDGDGRNDAEDACPAISDTNCQAIHSIANLIMMIRDDPNGYFRLADDRMMNTSWTSIASFTGTLDGDNYTISNLSAPLFGQIGRAATVTRIGIMGNVLARGN